MRIRRSVIELAIVTAVAFAVLAPGIQSYSLVDPWETHYGEVSRMMLQEHDYVHLRWPGTNQQGDPDEGFRSKPVLTFWMIAAGMKVVGLADHGGYSGEMVRDARTMVAIRLPIVAAAVLGLVLMWWMLARLVSRRAAWLALLVVGSCPFFCLVARQGMPDMPLCATVMGALAMLALAVEDGDRPASVRVRRIMLGVCGGMVVVQALYYAIYFILSPGLAIRGFPPIVLPVMMGLMLLGLWSRPWSYLRVPFRHLPRLQTVADRVLAMSPITSMRQVFLLWCYALLGISVLAKGPPGLAVVGLVGVAYVACLSQWRVLYEGGFELKRGILLMTAIALPWHVAMWLKDGVAFIDQYLFMHILDRAAANPDNSVGTFEMYTSQLGHGMWLWAALLPAAVAAVLVRARTDTREGRVRFLVALWAICGVAMFAIVQTKFHHYILPAVPALGILVALFLDDILAGRDRLHPIYAALGVAIVLLVTRDLMWEPARWVQMFVFLYNRPWPADIDPSDGFLALGAIAALAIVLAALPWRRVGVAALCVAGLAICLWSLHVYMPDAGTNWGMREAMRSYYQQRTIYGEKLVYFGAREVADDWSGVADQWTFETFIPDGLVVGQPMTITVEVHKSDDDRVIEQTLTLVGAVSAIGDHSVAIALPRAERAKLDPLIARGKESSARGRAAIRVVDADRLIAYILYWRGENFWSGEEVWGWLPELKTSFPDANKPQMMLKYLADGTKAPPGRRYFVISDAGHAPGLKSQLPTQHARDTFEVIETTSNKFSMSAFWL